MDIQRLYEEGFNPDEEYLGRDKEINKIEPLVSVCTATYQHADYIEDCIEGILIQKTDFPIEIIIGEDESTDGTREICKKYAEKYPDKIRLFLRNRKTSCVFNEKGERIYGFNGKWARKSARGKYIAMCEGDDYWTNPLKLQKQVEFMEENEDCSLCFHAAEHVYEDDSGKNFIDRPKNIPADFKFSVKDAITKGGGFMATNSMFFKREHIQKIPDWLLEAPVGDSPLMAYLGTKGFIGYIDESMGVYRKEVEGSWSDLKKENNQIKKTHLVKMKKMWSEFNKATDYEFNPSISIRKRKLNKAIIRHLLKHSLKKLLRYN